METIEDSKYDRQIRIFGLESNNLLKNGSVCISSDIKYIEYAKEVVKNLALCGINKMYLNNDIYSLKDYINLLNDSITVYNDTNYESDCIIFINIERIKYT